MDKNTQMLDLVKRSKSNDPEEAAAAKAELESMAVAFNKQSRSGIESR